MRPRFATRPAPYLYPGGRFVPHRGLEESRPLLSRLL